MPTTIATTIREKERGDDKRKMMTRRSFIASSLLLAAGACVPAFSPASTEKYHFLSLYNTHTDERLRIHYHRGRVSDSEIRALEYFLRDFRTGEMHAIDTDLLDTLWMIQNRSGKTGPYEVISGYRSPETNEFLRKKSGGVDVNSLHMMGRAIDVRLTGLETDVLHDMALNLHHGGVGYYPDSNFVHIDTGGKRSWAYWG